MSSMKKVNCNKFSIKLLTVKKKEKVGQIKHQLLYLKAIIYQLLE